MAGVVFYITLVFLFISCAKCGLPKSPQSLSSCDIIPLSVYDCDDDNRGYMDVKMTLNTVDDNGGKSFDMIVDVPETLNEEYTAILKIDKLSDGGRAENIYYGKDSACTMLLNYAPKLWDKVKAEMVPPIDEECQIKPGHYELRNFNATPGDLAVPVSSSGTFKLTLEFFNPDEELCVCKQAEGEIIPP